MPVRLTMIRLILHVLMTLCAAISRNSGCAAENCATGSSSSEQRQGTVIGQRAFELRQLGWAVFVDTGRDSAADDLAGIAMTGDCAVPMVTNDQLGDHARRARSMGHRRAFEDAVLAADVRIAHNGRAAVEPPEDARLPGYRPAADTRRVPPDYTHATWLPARRQMAAAWRGQAAARAAARWCALHLGKTITPPPAKAEPTEFSTPPAQPVPPPEAHACPHTPAGAPTGA